METFNSLTDFQLWKSIYFSFQQFVKQFSKCAQYFLVSFLQRMKKRLQYYRHINIARS